ncbi:MAG: glutamyl-tRNA reductase, partial [Planctomycetes bacterium]|nr:glutamyl-tRNA reductase [Planctomycetota bacterium]
MKICVIGVSHHTAPVQVREQFALSGGLARQLLRTFHDEPCFSEALVLDTCNRTEVYFVTNKQGDWLEYVRGHLARLKQVDPTDAGSAFYNYEGPDAVKHLFRVAASLDSQIVGEPQILGQLKAAYTMALEERTARFLLNKLLHRAFRVGKRVQSETRLCQGDLDVPRAAVELARQVFSDLTGKAAMLVGA